MANQEYDMSLAIIRDVNSAIGLESSERDKEYRALREAIDLIEVGGVTVPSDGSGGLMREGNDILHSNILAGGDREHGQSGFGSVTAIPRLFWDRNGHITHAEEIPLRQTIDENDGGIPSSSAVYSAVKAEMERAKAEEKRVLDLVEKGALSYVFTATVPKDGWMPSGTNFECKVENPLFVNDVVRSVNGKVIELGYVLTVSYPIASSYIAYRSGLHAFQMNNGVCWFKCDACPVDNTGERVDVPVKFVLSKVVVK